MPEIVANGLRLYYQVEGQGPAVLLLHPVGLDLTCWSGQVEALAPEFRVLRVDLRGHGRSEVPPPPYSLEDFADDVHLLLRALDLGPVHAVGLSLGGMVAQLLALDHPEDVRSLVLADTNCTLPPEGRQTMTGRAEAAEQGGMQAVVQSTLERWFTAEFLGSSVVARCRQRLLADSVTGWAATWRALSRLNTEPRLGEVRVPALVITGERDVSATPAQARRMAELIPGAAFHIIPGAPHMAPLQCPELFNARLLGFLHSLEPAR